MPRKFKGNALLEVPNTIEGRFIIEMMRRHLRPHYCIRAYGRKPNTAKMRKVGYRHAHMHGQGHPQEVCDTLALYIGVLQKERHQPDFVGAGTNEEMRDAMRKLIAQLGDLRAKMNDFVKLIESLRRVTLILPVADIISDAEKRLQDPDNTLQEVICALTTSGSDPSRGDAPPGHWPQAFQA